MLEPLLYLGSGSILPKCNGTVEFYCLDYQSVCNLKHLCIMLISKPYLTN